MASSDPNPPQADRALQAARSAYCNNPHGLPFQVLLLGVCLLGVGVGALAFHLRGDLANGDVVAVMVIPGAVFALVAGIVLWCRRPLIDAELKRAAEEWPELAEMLRAMQGEPLSWTSALVERGYRTSTARRAILWRWNRLCREVRRRNAAQFPPVVGRGTADTLPLPARPVRIRHDAHWRPPRGQLAPAMISPFRRLLASAVVVFCGGMMLSAQGMGAVLNRVQSMAILMLLAAIPYLLMGIADTWRYYRVAAEVDRAVAEWPELVRRLQDATTAGEIPTRTLRRMGYRHYPVRRAILRCFHRMTLPAPAPG